MPESRKEKEDRLIAWIKENRPKVSQSTDTAATVSADQLPYYGKYCGSFAEQVSDGRGKADESKRGCGQQRRARSFLPLLTARKYADNARVNKRVAGCGGMRRVPSSHEPQTSKQIPNVDVMFACPLSGRTFQGLPD